MPTNRLHWIGLIACLLLAGCAASSVDPGSFRGVSIVNATNSLVVKIDGNLFTEYHFQDVPRPYFYPLLGPAQQPLTRNWPMLDTPGEEHDHPHHRSLWFAHGAVNGVDFWTEKTNFGKIVHAGFTEIKSGLKSGVIKSRDNWVAADGKNVCTDDRVFRVYNRPEGKLFDFEVTLHASHGALTLGDTKEGTMALRLAETMRLKGPTAQGHIVNSAGIRDGETWGKHAEWCDCYGPVQGKIFGVAIFDHPQNPRHPTTWMVRDYGLFAVNPFGWHEFEKKPAGAGDLTIPAGQSITFRYRFYLHEGDEKAARVKEMYQEYAREPAK